MPLPAGTRLGPYEILSPIGKGGMGEVYKGVDTRLHREVAIKVSAERFSERFEREARAIAALNHPNICTLFDVGPNYLVMEFVDGEAINTRLKSGAIPLEESIAIARQIASALECAHEKLITHRDLKPGNVMVKPDGVVKVLDFGLAKFGSAAPASVGEDSPTLTMGATVAGTILGTAAYMSPEQAKGKPVDKRADIWAFGVLLHEMVTGRQLFKGEDLTDTIAAVVMRDPDLSDVPTRIRPVLERCLVKDPTKRLRDITGVELLLERKESAPAIIPSVPSRERQGAVIPWLIAAALALTTALALWSPWRTTPIEDRPLVRLDVDLGPDVTLPPSDSGAVSLAISPDGTRLAYISGTPTRVFTRRLDQPKTTELLGTQGAQNVYFYPDGQWLAFKSGKQINKLSVDGGAVVPLGEINQWAGVDWEKDGSLLVSQPFSKGIWRIPAAGGPPETVAALGKGELVLAQPQILPGGKGILVSMSTGRPEENAFQVLTPADGKRKTVGRGGASFRFIPSPDGTAVGHLIYNNQATLFAIPFDLDKLETRGTAVPILDDLAYATLSTLGHFDFSRTGTFVYRRIGTGGTSAVQWVDPTGKRVPVGAKPGTYFPPPVHPALSPDGKRVALTLGARGREGTDIWVYDTQRDSMARLTFSGGTAAPLWSPDGQYIVYQSAQGITQVRTDASTQPQPLVSSPTLLSPGSFTPDGKRLAYTESTGSRQVLTVALEEQQTALKAGNPEQLLTGTGSQPMFSPDGRWLAYVSNESGRSELYVRAFPAPATGQGGKLQISNTGGNFPRWSRAAHELVYQSGNQLMTVSYTVQADTFVPGKPRVWIDKLGSLQWDLAPDGKRVVALTPVEAAQAPAPDHEIVMLQNFFDELRRKVPLEGK